MKGKVIAVCVSESKGTPKTDVGEGYLLPDVGIEGDAHAGFAHRQISMLAVEDIEIMKERLPDLVPGSFAENITVEDFDLSSLSIGDRVRVGEALLELSQIGKECHTRCAVYHSAGDCIMPRKGLFFRVIEGGRVATGDAVERS
ncbi:MAG: MOSC domain-containing protein [Thermovirgaceae bacterium]|nr:MOSC domain-containing protein [Synergistales bacterium]MDI9393430.1 MOSC domain-containing protein [Synergistota bacterium]MDY0178763.1 MOSC domain-containing protein [Synergistaceae bacterium]HRW87263.1 MOSC domain-containing protein [Thermovirgaceae bacterium]MDD3134106.1 MOSC domain-containing protein [Synergistales bacterium]